MVVDASALLAIALQEHDGPRYSLAINDAGPRWIAAPTLLEAAIAITVRKGAGGLDDLDRLVKMLGIVVVEFGAGELEEARRAHLTFGRGRHPAKLNFGDCIAYATAKVRGEPLLYKGDDFARTDIISAL